MMDKEKDTATNTEEVLRIINKDKLRELLGIAELEQKIEKNYDRIQGLAQDIIPVQIEKLEQKISELQNLKDIHLVRISALEDLVDKQQSGNTQVHMENIERIEKLETEFREAYESLNTFTQKVVELEQKIGITELETKGIININEIPIKTILATNLIDINNIKAELSELKENIDYINTTMDANEKDIISIPIIKKEISELKKQIEETFADNLNEENNIKSVLKKEYTYKIKLNSGFADFIEKNHDDEEAKYLIEKDRETAELYKTLLKQLDGSKSVNPSKSPSVATEKLNTSQMGTEEKPSNCPECGTKLHECGTNPERLLYLCNNCGYKIKQEEKPSSICTLKEQRECYSYKTMFCLSPKITTCMHGKTELEKEKWQKELKEK